MRLKTHELGFIHLRPQKDVQMESLWSERSAQLASVSETKLKVKVTCRLEYFLQ